MIKEKDIKSWYDQKHRSFGDKTWRPFEAYPKILEYLNPEEGERLLDVGCGTGFLIQAADELGLETYGLDISEEGIKIAKRNSPNSKLEVGRAEDLDYPDKFFDYVICLGALEHFLDMKKSIREMIRVGKNDARFCFIVPNVDYFIWKCKDSTGTEQQEINERLLSLDEWKKFFRENGLDILNIHKDQWRVKKKKIFSSVNPIDIIKKILFKLTWKCLPLRYTYQFIFIMSKR